MTARVAIAMMLLVAAAAGAGLYYAQVYAYYREVPAAEIGPVTLVDRQTGAPIDIGAENLRAIDSDSSPIRFRGCFSSHATADELAVAAPYTDAEPLVAPGWFDCFDAAEIGTMLETGGATTWLGEADVSYGVDLVVALAPDGRGWLWHQINACGAVVFAGEPPPAGCPEPPDGVAAR